MEIVAENTSAQDISLSSFAFISNQLRVNVNFIQYALADVIQRKDKLFNSCLTDRNINYDGGGSLVAKLSAVDGALRAPSSSRASRVRFPAIAFCGTEAKKFMRNFRAKELQSILGSRKSKISLVLRNESISDSAEYVHCRHC